MISEEELNFDDMSDEDFKKAYDKLIATPAPEPQEEAPQEEEQHSEEPAEHEGEGTEATEAPAEVAEGDEAEVPEEGEEGEEASQEEMDYRAAYEYMTAPFKANGIEMKVDNPQQAVKLMQMGANYTKKMQQISPGLKIVETLKQEGLLDQNKINHLIDIYKKNPQAIAKLVEDSDIDLLSIDSEEAKSYVPNEYTVSDEEFRFQQVLDEIVEDPDGLELLRSAQDWDVETKLDLQKSPDQLQVLVEQKKSGVYDLITQELERQKVFSPQLANMPFLGAYQAVGQYLLQQQQQSQPQHQVVAPVEVRAQSQRQKATGNVKAASQVRNSQPKHTPEPDWESMSDEEFAQYYNQLIFNKK